MASPPNDPPPNDQPPNDPPPGDSHASQPPASRPPTSQPQRLIAFDPASPRPRHDGWTADRQIRFIEALAQGGCVDRACRLVGLSPASAYALRNRPCGAPFRRAWDAALDCGMHRIEQAAIARALDGVARPIFHNGEQVGEWRHHDERLTMFLLRSRRPARYGKWLDKMLAPDPEGFGEDDGIALDGWLTEIEFNAPNKDGNPLDESCEADGEDKPGNSVGNSAGNIG
ncbi:MAG: hypothetical protein ABIW33_01645 [Sphingomicrobium sp.]